MRKQWCSAANLSNLWWKRRTVYQNHFAKYSFRLAFAMMHWDWNGFFLFTSKESFWQEHVVQWKKNVGNEIFSLRNEERKYLAKSSFNSRTNSSAVHWSESVVKPQMSANKMLKRNENCKLYLDIYFTKIGFL